MTGTTIIYEEGDKLRVTFDREPGERGDYLQPPGDHTTTITEIYNETTQEDITEQVRDNGGLWWSIHEICDNIPTVELQ